MVKLIIVRHGYSASNQTHRFAGQTDVPLIEKGLMQAEKVSRYLVEHHPIDVIYSSDLQRAVNTVKPAADALGLPICTRRDLREIDVGDWAGYLLAELQEASPALYQEYMDDRAVFHFPNGEGKEELAKRSVKAVEEIVRENDGKTVLIATHGGVINALLRRWNAVLTSPDGQEKMVGNASTTVVECDGETVRVLQLGYVGYLEQSTGEIAIN